MKKKMTGSEAKRILSEVEPEKAFWVNNGPVLRSLSEFADAVGKLNSAQLLHHVNSAKNDFAKWVDEAVGDNVLAQRLKLMKKKNEIAKVVLQRVSALKDFVK